MQVLRSFGFLTAVVLLAACEKEGPPRSTEPVASVDKNAALDPAVARAVAAASASAAKAAPAASGGPPPNGIFAPGAADREIRRGAPPKLTIGASGSEPRVKIGPLQPKPGWKATGTFELALQQDVRQGALPVEVQVTLEAQKAQAGDAGAGEASGAVSMTARVKEATVPAAGVPRDVAAKVAAMKGARVEYSVMPDGSGAGFRYELPPGAPELRDYLRALGDAIALVTLPAPSSPVGQGAYWMATSREGAFGMDLVTYRLVKVEAVAGDRVTLSVGTRRYATSSRFDFEGLPPDAPRDLSEFEAKADGRVELRVGAPFPVGGELNSVLAAGLGDEKGPRGTMQIRSRVGLAFPVPGPGPAAPGAQ